MVADSLNPNTSDPSAWELVAYALAQTDHAQKCDGPTSESFFPPDSFSGYELGPMIHRGGQGVVFRAKQRSTGRTVAIKVLRDGLVASDTDRERLAREARILVELDHPNIVGISDSGVAAGHFYIVMDLVDGVALDEFVHQGKLPVRTTLELFTKVCEAVQVAHLKGVIHRDLKPSNIRVTADGRPRVLDFGLAKIVGHNGSAKPDGSNSITETGRFVGSLPWASPEQARGDWDRVDTRADVYSLGVILFHLLTEKFPYGVLGPWAEVFASISKTQPTRPRVLNASVESDVETILLRCLDKDPERRYQTAGELARDLRRYLCGDPIEAKRDSALYVLRKRIRRYRVGVGVACVILVILTGATIVSNVSLKRARVAEATSKQSATEARVRFQLANKTARAVLRELKSEFEKATWGAASKRPVLEIGYATLAPLANETSNDPADWLELSESLFLLGDIAIGLGRREEGRAHLRASERLRRELLSLDPNDSESWSQLSITLVRLGDSFGDEGDDSTRLSYYIKAWRIDEDLVKREPGNSHFADNLGWSYERLSHLAALSHELPSEEELLNRAVAIFEGLVAAEPENPTRWMGLTTMRTLQATRIRDRGELIEARTMFEAALQCAERVVQLEPEKPGHSNQLARILRPLSQVTKELGDLEEADRLAGESERAIERILAVVPEEEWDYSAVWGMLGTKAEFAQARGDWETEDKYLQRRLDFMDNVFLPRTGNSADALEEKFENLHGVAVRRYEHGAGESVRRLEEEAIRIGEALTSHDNASASRLVTYSKILRQAVPPELRNPGRAVQVAGRAVEITNGKAFEPLQEFTLALVADGQIERARNVQRQALDLLPSTATPIRSGVLDAVPSEKQAPPHAKTGDSEY